MESANRICLLFVITAALFACSTSGQVKSFTHDSICDTAADCGDHFQKYSMPYYLEPILFSTATTRKFIGKDVQAKLLKTVEFIKNEPHAIFQIEGHVAPSGDDNADIALAQKIADQALVFLLSKGVSREHFASTISYGSGKPKTFSWPSGENARIEQVLIQY